MPRIDRAKNSPPWGPFDHVLITGASSGLGAAFAHALARPGTTLHLGGRDTARLDAVAATCRVRGAAVQTRVVSVTDRAAMAGWIAEAGQLDLVIANAGISGGFEGVESAAQAHTMFETNLAGALHTILPAAEAMAEQTPGPDGVRGRIAAIASIAAFIPAPVAPAYAASKAALDSWMLGSAGAWARRGVMLSSVCPGFIRSPMTARNNFPMPGLMDADQAAARALRGIGAGQRRVSFPRWFAAGARLTALLPPGLQARIVERGDKPAA